jgi:hypothetical protein
MFIGALQLASPEVKFQLDKAAKAQGGDAAAAAAEGNVDEMKQTSDSMDMGMYQVGGGLVFYIKLTYYLLYYLLITYIYYTYYYIYLLFILFIFNYLYYYTYLFPALL